MNKPNELLPRLKTALDNYHAATGDIAAHSSLHDEAQAAITDFAATADLRNLQTIATIAPRQAQITFINLRMEALNKVAAAADQELGDAVSAARGELRDAAIKIRCGVTERTAQAMKEHYSTLQEARRQARQSTKVRERSTLAPEIENLGLNEEVDEIAAIFLKMAPELFGEVSALEKELGGNIPNDAELMAI